MAKPSGDGRIRVGIIGSGAISQIIHLPILRQLREQFEIAALCDISAAAVQEAPGRRPATAAAADARGWASRPRALRSAPAPAHSMTHESPRQAPRAW